MQTTAHVKADWTLAVLRVDVTAGDRFLELSERLDLEIAFASAVAGDEVADIDEVLDLFGLARPGFRLVKVVQDEHGVKNGLAEAHEDGKAVRRLTYERELDRGRRTHIAVTCLSMLPPAAYPKT
jgi:hypothetical protein